MKEQTVVLRPGRPADSGPIEALLEAEGLTATFVAEEFLVAEDDEAIVGCARLRGLAEGCCELASVAVLPERRGEGIGQALVEQTLDQAEGTVHALCLEPGFFARFGFEPAEEIPHGLQAKARACCSDRGFVPMTRRAER